MNAERTLQFSAGQIDVLCAAIEKTGRALHSIRASGKSSVDLANSHARNMAAPLLSAVLRALVEADRDSAESAEIVGLTVQGADDGCAILRVWPENVLAKSVWSSVFGVVHALAAVDSTDEDRHSLRLILRDLRVFFE